MTHDELLDYIDKFDAAGMVNEPAVSALRAVVELHKPYNHPINCSYCNTPYPCDEIQTIKKAIA